MARNQSSEFKRILDGNKIFNKKSLTKNALEYLASGKDFIMDRLRLEILTRILNKIFNQDEVWGLKSEVWGLKFEGWSLRFVILR